MSRLFIVTAESYPHGGHVVITRYAVEAYDEEDAGATVLSMGNRSIVDCRELHFNRDVPCIIDFDITEV